MNWRELNKARLFLAVGLLFALAGATVFRTPAIVFLCAVLASAPFVAALIGRLGARQLRVTCAGPTLGRVGDQVNAQITITNTGRWPLFLVQVRAGDQHVSPENAAPVTWRTRALDVWRSVRPQRRDDEPLRARSADEILVPFLGAGQSAHGEFVWELRRRGFWKQDGMRAGVLDPLGLHLHLETKTPLREIEVRPPIVRLNHLAWSGTGSGAQTPNNSAAVSEASDLHGVRPHRPGEGLRRVHWKSTARTGVLHVVEWEDETAADLLILLDARMKGEALESAICAAASCASYLLSVGQGVELFWWQKGDSKLPVKLVRISGRHPGHLDAILRELTRLERADCEAATLESLARTALKFAHLRVAPLFLAGAKSDWSAAKSVCDALGGRDGRAGVLLWGAGDEPLPSRTRRVGPNDALGTILQRAV